MLDAMHPFKRVNDSLARTPIIISVPHAGRNYPADCASMARVPLDRLVRLEDRYADQLAVRCMAAGMYAIIARVPRLWIDLNRSEADVDPAMLIPPHVPSAPISHKARGGLGLVPRRLAGVGDIWHAPLHRAALAARIEQLHRPYHAAISTGAAAARTRFGAALIIDLHSMPPLNISPAPDVVIGDRFGRTADPRLTEAARAIFEAAGLRVAVNVPYPGGHILERHGQPHTGVHALQLEIDRRLYLDAHLLEPGMGLKRMQDLVHSVAISLGRELLAPGLAEAAE
jgi:N-formylglutamate amidohydrolase